MPKVEEPEQKPQISKRKKRALEAVAKKKAMQAQRGDVIASLRTMRLTEEQRALMQPTAHTTKSKKDDLIMIQRRKEAGLEVDEPAPKKAKKEQDLVPVANELLQGQSSWAKKRARKTDSHLRADENAPPNASTNAVPRPGTSETTEDASSSKETSFQAQPGMKNFFPTTSSASFQAKPGMRNFFPPTSSSRRQDNENPDDDVERLPEVTPPQANMVPPPKVNTVHIGGASSSSAPAFKKTPAVSKPLEYPRGPRPDIARLERVEEMRHRLPAVMMEQEIVECVLENDVIVLCGDTGCGKSTQVPQFLYEAGFAPKNRQIAITQPRRVAAVSICLRVAQELNEPKLVEYQVRYERSHRAGTKDDVRMKFMTDGILLREVQGDFMLRKYGVVVIDEAHERSVNCDILIGLLSRVVTLRREEYDKKKEGSCPLKLIIMSATLRLCDFTENAKLFATPPPVISVDAKTFPVTLHFDRYTEDDYVDAAAKKVREIHKRLPPGSILVFVTGRKEVHRLCNLLNKRKLRKNLRDDSDSDGGSDGDFDDRVEMSTFAAAPMIVEMAKATEVLDEAMVEEDAFALGEENEDKTILDADNGEKEDKDPESLQQKRVQMSKLDRSRTCKGLFAGGDSSASIKVMPLYAQLPAKMQLEVFNPPDPNQRIVVVATNVAETSVTIPNVRYVVDCGKEKKRKYNQSNGLSWFNIQWISKASANQRSGRSGRVGPGHCYRIYSSAVFNDHFVDFPPINILSTPIDATLLFLGALGIPEIMSFPWPTAPPRAAVQFAADRLLALGAVDENKRVTTLGKRISVLPVAPRYGKMLLQAVRASCDCYVLDLACVAVAGLSVSNLFVLEGKLDAMPHWATLADDLEAMLWAIGGFMCTDAAKQPDFCKTNALQPKQMEEARDLSNQLAALLNKKLDLGKWNLQLHMPLVPNMKPTKSQLWVLKECVLQGLIDHIGIQCEDEVGMYRTPSHHAFIHQRSNCARRRPRPYIVAFNEVMKGNNGKNYLDMCVSVDAAGLAKAAATDNFNTPLIKKGELLKAPAPRYLPESDKVVGFFAPTYAPLDLSLPTIEVALSSSEMSAVRVFAKMLLAGKVCPKLAEFAGCLKPGAQQKLLHGPGSQPFVAKLLGKACSRAELEKLWKQDRSFLLDEYLSFVLPTEHKVIKAKWPPI
eukprot:GEMP01004574.1.p1 GENE.GEMP01004574.1~~GEMP01004574.1.p1  ORF type:complete len:1212 (+),score=350.82 GEMP01004574.1:134-3637(+)